MIKKIIALLLVILTLVSVVGCSNNGKDVTYEMDKNQIADMTKEDEKTVTAALDEFLSKNYQNYKIVKVTNFVKRGEHEGTSLSYDATFFVKIEDKDCKFFLSMVKDAPARIYTDLYYDTIMEEFKQFLDTNDLLKTAKEKEYIIEMTTGQKKLPAEIKTLKSLLEVACLQKINIAATFTFENKKDFCPEKIDVANVTKEFSNYKITLYNTNGTTHQQNENKKVANLNTSILDRIEYSMNIVDKNKKDEVVPATSDNGSTSNWKDNYEKSISVTYKHNNYQKINDLIFCYDNRFFDININETKLSSDINLSNDNLYRYIPSGKGYNISFVDKVPEGIAINNTAAQYVNYQYKDSNGIVYSVLEYYDELDVVYPLTSYQGLVPYYTSIVLPTEISNKDYIELDLSTIEGNEIILGFYTKEPNINT